MKRQAHRLVLLPVYVAALLMVIWTLFPFAVAFSTALRRDSEVTLIPPRWIPPHPSLSSFVNLWGVVPLQQYILNSVIICVSSTCIALSAGILAAFALARLRFPGRRFYLYLILFTQMFSPIVLIIPLFKLFAQVGLTDNLLGVIIADSAFMLPFTTWLLYGFFQAAPQETLDAGAIDGCGRLGVLVRLLLPMARPGLVAVAVFAFAWVWNDFLFAFTFLNSPNLQTVPVGIFGFVSQWDVAWNDMMAAILLAILPVVVLFLAVERQIVQGLSEGAAK